MLIIASSPASVLRTSLLQEDAALCDHNRNIAIYVALPMLVDEGYRNISIGDALPEGYAENAWTGFC